MKVAELEALLDLDDGPYQRKMNEADRQAGGLGKSVGAAGVVIAGAMATAGAAAGAFGIKAVMAGSSLNEVISKNAAVFKDQAKAIEGWADDAADDFGQSKQQALDAASSFGNLFVQLGIGRGKAGEMSMAMTELASDFASFHDADISEVLTAQTAAFRGEYDALQRFVPTINAAAVEQEAMAMTGKKNADSLTAQEKALATQALMLKGAGDAAGDFDRTNESLANRMRAAKADFADFTAEVGMRLLPVVLDAWDLFDNKLVPALSNVGDSLGTAKQFVSDFASGFRDGKDEVDGTRNALGQFGSDAGRSVDFINEALGRFSEMASVILADVQQYFVDNQARVQEWKDTASNLLTELSATFGLVFEAIGVIITVFTAVAGAAWSAFGQFILDYMAARLEALMQIIGGALQIIQGILNVFIGIFTGDWSRAWSGVEQIASGAWQILVGLFNSGKATLVLAWQILTTALGAAWSAVWSGITALASSVWGGIKSGVSAGLSAIVELVKGIGSSISQAASSAFGGLETAFKSVVNGIIRLWNNLSFGIPGVEVPGIGKVGGASIDTPNIPFLANGGFATSPGLAIVGERGPELAFMNRGAGIMPLDHMASPFGGVTIQKIEIHASDADSFVAALPELERALAAGVGRIDRTR